MGLLSGSIKRRSVDAKTLCNARNGSCGMWRLSHYSLSATLVDISIILFGYLYRVNIYSHIAYDLLHKSQCAKCWPFYIADTQTSYSSPRNLQSPQHGFHRNRKHVCYWVSRRRASYRSGSNQILSLGVVVGMQVEWCGAFAIVGIDIRTRFNKFLYDLQRFGDVLESVSSFRP